MQNTFSHTPHTHSFTPPPHTYTHTLSLPRQQICLLCAQFSPKSPWASMKSRKFDNDTWEEHTHSLSHTTGGLLFISVSYIFFGFLFCFDMFIFILFWSVLFRFVLIFFCLCWTSYLDFWFHIFIFFSIIFLNIRVILTEQTFSNYMKPFFHMSTNQYLISYWLFSMYLVQLNFFLHH